MQKTFGDEKPCVLARKTPPIFISIADTRRAVGVGSFPPVGIKLVEEYGRQSIVRHFQLPPCHGDVHPNDLLLLNYNVPFSLFLFHAANSQWS